MIEEILLQWRVDDSELVAIRKVLQDTARAAGATEEEVQKIGDSFDQSAKDARKFEAETKRVKTEVSKLKKEADGLEKSLQSATDPSDQKRYRDELEKTRRELARLEGQADQTSRSTRSIGGRLQGFNLGNSLSFAAGGVAFGGIIESVQSVRRAIGETVDAATEFERQTQQLGAITGLDTNSEQFRNLRKDLLDFRVSLNGFGPDIRASATEAAQGLANLGSQIPSLLPLPDVLLEVQKQAVLLASTDINLDTATATSAVSAIANAFGQVDANDPTQTLDNVKNTVQQLATASQLGSANVGNIIQSINLAGGAAAAAEVPLNETLAAIETIATNEALKGAQGGTALRNFFTILSTGADETNPKIVGLQTALQNLQPVIENEQEAVKLFGRENLAAARLLVENRAEVERLSDALGAGGLSTAYEQAATNQNSYAARQAQVTAQIESLRIEIGEKILPVLSDFLGFVSRLIDNVDKLTPSISKNQESASRLAEAWNRFRNILGFANEETDRASGLMSFLNSAISVVTAQARTLVNVFTFVVESFNSAFEFGQRLIGGLNGLGRAFSSFIDNIRNLDIGGALAALNPANLASQFALGFDEVDTQQAADRLAKRTVSDLEKAFSEASQTGFAGDVQSNISNQIFAALDAGIIDEAQAEAYQNRLFEAVQNQLNENPPSLSVSPKVDANLQALENQIPKPEPVKVDADTKAAENALQQLKRRVDNLQFGVQLQLAGGADSLEGSRLLEERAVAQLMASDELRQLRIENETIANEAILQERLRFNERIAGAATLQTIDQVEQTRISQIIETEAFRTASVERQLEVIDQVETEFAQRREELRKQETETVFQTIETRNAAFETQIASLSEAFVNQQNLLVERELEIANLNAETGEERIRQAQEIVNRIANVESRARAQALLDAGDFAALETELLNNLAEDRTRVTIANIRKQLQEVQAFADENIARIQALREAESLGAAEQAELEAREALRSQLGERIVAIKGELLGQINEQNDAIVQAEQNLADRVAGIFQQLGDDSFAAIASSVASIIDAVNAAKQAGSQLQPGEILGLGLQGVQAGVGAIFDFARDRREAELKAAEGDEKKQLEIRKRQFESEKKESIANAIISGSIAVLKALELGPIAGPIFAAIITAKTILEVNKIRQQQFPGFRGGIVDLGSDNKGRVAIGGPGTATSDSIPAKISRGESIITAKATAKHRQILESINSDKIGPNITQAITRISSGRTESDRMLLRLMAGDISVQEAMIRPAKNEVLPPVIVGTQDVNIDAIRLENESMSRAALRSVVRSLSDRSPAVSIDYDRLANTMAAKIKESWWDDNNPVKQLLRASQWGGIPVKTTK